MGGEIGDEMIRNKNIRRVGRKRRTLQGEGSSCIA